jgi:hypothetical protein
LGYAVGGGSFFGDDMLGEFGDAVSVGVGREIARGEVVGVFAALGVGAVGDFFDEFFGVDLCCWLVVLMQFCVD